MTLHRIEPNQQTIHGAFSRDLDPVLTIDSGDTVRFRTLDSDWNLDGKELVVGSTLYLPIAVAGGLFSVGDGHARQGDGESCVTAIECPMECVELTFELHTTLVLTTPRAKTPAGWITFGLHEDLDEAALIALEAMVDLLIQRYGLERHHAVGLAGVVVDLRITQIVNGVRGVHAVLPREAVAELGLKEP